MIYFVTHHFWHILAVCSFFLVWAGVGSVQNCADELRRIRLLIEGEAQIGIEEQAKLN